MRLKLSAAWGALDAEMNIRMQLPPGPGERLWGVPSAERFFTGAAFDFGYSVAGMTHVVFGSGRPGEEPARSILGFRLSEVRAWYRGYYLDAPGDGDARRSQKAGLRTPIDLIGYADRDRNALPDAVDVRLDQWGIDPTTLPVINAVLEQPS